MEFSFSCGLAKCCQYPPLQFLWTKIRSTWPDNYRNWLYWSLLAHFRRKMTQTVTRFGCVGFSMYACGFSVPQMRQFWFLFTYPSRSKWASSEKMIFFAKIGIFCKSIAGPLSEAYTQPYSFGGRIKLIICQIRHELSVTIQKISTS